MFVVQKKKILLITYLSSNMKILIAGYGFVGKAVANALKEEHFVVAIDPQYNEYKISEHTDADGIIVCVGTPSTLMGDCSSEQILNVLEQIPVYMPVLIKSTVTPDLVNTIMEQYPDHSICFNPEFLTASNADADFLNQKHMILGGNDPESFWQELFQSVLKECKLYFYCTPTEASMVKYTVNSFLATKVAFFNQINELCENNELDFEVIRRLVAHDIRIGPSHTLVPGPDGMLGFGGACFPKDTWAFTNFAKRAGTPLTIINSAVAYNDKIRR